MPLLFSNEAKYEECVKILDSYEDQLTELFTSAHGDDYNFIYMFHIALNCK